MDDQINNKKENSIIRFGKNNWAIILAIGYVLWPLDIIPDIFAALGGPVVWLDDSIILLIAIVDKVIKILRKPKEIEE